MHRLAGIVALLAAVGLGPAQAAEDQPVTVDIKRLSMEMALKAARTAVETCREKGVQVAATVVDRSGHEQAVLRDVLAMDLTLTISKQKAYTALSFNAPLSQLEDRFSGSYSVPKIDGLIVTAGAVPIESGGAILGAIGVSGAPSGETDEACAKAGADAIADDLAFGGM